MVQNIYNQFWNISFCFLFCCSFIFSEISYRHTHSTIPL